MKSAKEKTSSEKMLTDVELQLMAILWRLGEGSVNDVLAELPKERPLAYTSVSTMLRILEQKGVVEARKEGRGHVYMPLLKKADYEQKAVRHVVDRVFDGTAVPLVRQLLESGNLSAQDIADIRRLLDKKETPS